MNFQIQNIRLNGKKNNIIMIDCVVSLLLSYWLDWALLPSVIISLEKGKL